MIQATPHMRILVAVEPADFRKGIDGLARVCKEVLKQDPFRGWVFVFRNHRATAVKILVYDGQSFGLCHKRLSSGRFRWWPASRTGVAKVPQHVLDRAVGLARLVVLAPARRTAQQNPVGRPVARAPVPPGVHEGLQEVHRVAVGLQR